MAFAFMEDLTLREFMMVNEASGQTRFFDTKLWHVIVMAVVFGAGLQATWQNFFWLHQSLRNDLILDATGALLLGLFVRNYLRIQRSQPPMQPSQPTN